ncbi:unnamed protein product, partial [Owenia fusiformis]
MPEKKPFQRLPNDVSPVNYDLRLIPNIEKFTFEGEEDISVQVKNATSKVLMNSVEIAVQSVQYTGEGQDITEGVDVTYQEEDETITLNFPQELKVGSGTLKIKFTGELNDKMKGFYRSKYFGPSGDERYGAVTQFEATDARRSFPCWDEPAVKATFDVTLTVPSNRVALSNMPVKSESVEGELKTLSYERTPVMSTYLLAYCVGEYDYVEAKDADGVLVRVYTPVGKQEQGQFALEVAVKTLPFYKEYFQIAYPLPKMDLIAIADFAAGAMENWGLVTYRETALLVDPVNSSSASKQWVALVVGHELAHQWFGNLVTMEWWTHLWLNEGFASWIEYLCVDFCFPEYDIWTQFNSQDLNKALELDAMKSSHPIEVPVGHPAEVDEIFDAISYSKGASVIRMLHDYVGDKDFRKGMNLYLNKFKHQNAFTEDLWAALEQSSGKPINKIMSGFTNQMGFPVLKVSQVQQGSNRVLTITQEKFCADGGSGDASSSTWMVPISVSTSSNPDIVAHRALMDQTTITLTLENVKEGEWVKLNAGNVGFYRVQYSSEMLDALLPAIKEQSIPPRDRLGLQSDLFALARAGVASTVDVLKVVEAFQNETNYTVWSDLSSNLASLKVILQYTDYYDEYKRFARNLFSKVMQILGWDKKEGEGHLDGLLRSVVIGQLGSCGCEETKKEAKKRLSAHIDGSSILPA